MITLSLLIGSFIPQAHAVSVNQIGTAGNGVPGMWSMITSVLPFSTLATTSLTPVAYFGLKFLSLVSSLIAASSVLMIIYAGLKIITGRGESEGLTTAKRIMTYAVIGLVFGMTTAAAVNYFILLYTCLYQGLSTPCLT